MAKTQIKVFGFDHKVVDEAAKKLVSLAVATKNKFVGPIPMPTKREEVTILRSVHVNKKISWTIRIKNSPKISSAWKPK